MSLPFVNARPSRPTRPGHRQAWGKTLLPLALIALGLLLAAWAQAVPSHHAFAQEFRACQHRLVVGYTTSGIEVSPDDTRTIREACERAVREHLQGRP